MNTGKAMGDLVRLRFAQWLGKEHASAWIMTGTLTLAAVSAAYLNPPGAHAVQPGSATHAPASSLVYPVHHCQGDAFGGY